MQAAGGKGRLDFLYSPGCLETLLCESVVLLQAGRMAISTHKVPVLQRARPVQDIAVVNLAVEIEVDLALADGRR